MASTNVTIRIDESLKKQLQELMSALGMDVTTYFTLAAKQAVREQALPFVPRMNIFKHDARAYELAKKNTKYNSEGRAVIAADDEWRNESEWDEMFEQMKKERENQNV